MKKSFSRIVSIIVTLAIVIGSIPISSMASTETEILREEFGTSLNTETWQVDGTAGAIENGVYKLYGGTDLRYTAKLQTDFSIEYDITLNDCDGWTALRFAKPTMSSTHESGADMLFIDGSGNYTLWKASKSGTIPSFAGNTSVHVKVENQGGKIKVYFNNATEPAQTVDNANGEGYVSFYTNGTPSKYAMLDNVLIKTYQENGDQAAVDAEAAKITEAIQPTQGQTQLTMPSVSAGYAIKIKTTQDSNIIDEYGSIMLVPKEQKVNVTFVVTNIASGLSADVSEMEITVPALKEGTVSETIMDEKFSEVPLNSKNWSTVVTGSASEVADGAFGIKNGTYLRSVQAVGTDYTIEYDLTLKDCGGWVGLLFNGAKQQDSSYNWDHGNSLIYIQPDGSVGSVATSVSGRYNGADVNEPIRVKLEVLDGKLKFFMNGQLISEGEYKPNDSSYFSFYHNGGDATSLLDNIRVITYEKAINLQEVADGITSVPNITFGDKRLTYPSVRASCNIEIESSSNEDIISKSGRISNASNAKTVDLVFKITSTKAEGYALTAPITVNVPAGTGVDNQGMNDFLQSKYGLFVHYVPRLTVNKDGSKIMNGAGLEIDNLDAFAKAFDVEQFVQDVKDMNVEYVIYTAWHANMVALYPSDAMKKYGLENHQVTGRDLIGEIIEGLNEANIDVYLYTHPRDGHDFPAAEAAKVGWTTQAGSGDPNFNTFNYDLWNDFINDVYGELIDKYGNSIKGLFVDEGSAAADSYRVVDYQRLRETIKSRNNNLVLMHNFYGTNYTMDVGVKEYFYWGEFDPKSGGTNGAQWPAYEIPVAAGIAKGGWWANDAQGTDVCSYSAEDMFRYTVLQASANTKGGGVSWAAGPYTYGDGWEKDIKERLVQIGAYMKPIEESIKQTLPSTAFPTKAGTTTGMVDYVATMKENGAYEYIHVLNAPTSGNEIVLGTPADGRVFQATAVALNDNTPVDVVQDKDTKEIKLVLKNGKQWRDLTATQKLDYVIKLTFDGANEAKESITYIDDTNRSIHYGGGTWSYQRWYRHNSYSSGWQTTVGGDYDGDIHNNAASGAYFEIPFTGTGISYMPSTSSGNTTSCDIYIDGILVQSGVSLQSSTYIPQKSVFEKTDLENTDHVLKVVNTGSGNLVNDVVKVYHSTNPEYLLSKIEIKNKPTKTQYIKGESLDIKGLAIKTIYNNGIEIERSSEDVTISGYDSQKVGSQTITVAFGGKQTTFEVHISDPNVATAFPVSIEDVKHENRSYNGEAYSYNGTPTFKTTSDGKLVSGITFTKEYEGRGGTNYTKSEIAPTNAGTYNLILMVSGDSAKTYVGSTTVPFTIEKAALSVKAEDKSVVKESPMPTFTYTVTGLIGSDCFTTEPTFTTTVSDTNTVGKYPIIVAGGVLLGADNYAVTYVGAILTVKEKFTDKAITAGNTKTPIDIKGKLTDGAKLTVTENTNSEDYKKLITTIDTEKNEIICSFDISITNGSFEGKLTLTFTIGEAYNGKMITIKHLKADGTIDIFTTICKDGKVSITVEELSPFILSVAKDIKTPTNPEIPTPETPTQGTPTPEKTSPKTGDENNILLFIGLMMAGGIVIFKRCRRKV